MISNPLFFLSVLISSFFAFFTTAFIVDLIINIFGIKQYRIRSTLKLLPFVSLIIDLLFNKFSIAYLINPLSCASCMQKFLLQIFFPQLKAHLNQNEVSLINYLGFDIKHIFFSAIFIAFLVLSLMLALRQIVQAFFQMYSLHSIKRRALLLERPLSNIQLKEKLKKNKVSVFLSDEIQIPLATHPKMIIIPQQMIQILSQQEFEAVIAHELEHLRFQDPFIRLISHSVAAFFWWVPMHSWMRKIEQEQELACDQNIINYGVHAESIASALLKVAKQVKTEQTFCHFVNPRNSTLGRLEALLGFNIKAKVPTFGLHFFGVLLGVFLLLACMIWL